MPLVANLSIPIPVFNTNKGAVQEAYNRRKKAEEQRRQIEIAISTNLNRIVSKSFGHYIPKLIIQIKSSFRKQRKLIKL